MIDPPEKLRSAPGSSPATRPAPTPSRSSTPTPAPSADTGGASTESPIARALVLLNNEARQLAKTGNIDIRGKPDFAERKNLRVANAEVLRVMGTTLQRDPLLDAYVKWQLLSFEPDIAHATGDQIVRILVNAPGLMPTPQMGSDVERIIGDAPAAKAAGGLQVTAGMRSSRQRTIVLGYEPIPGSNKLKPKVAVLREGNTIRSGGDTSSSDRYVGPDLSVSRQELIDIRERAAAVNKQVGAFRDALMAELPAQRGVRMSATLHDLVDRVRAGDRSVDRASERMVDELRKEIKENLLDEPTRRGLGDQLVDLVAMKVEVIRSISSGDEHGIDFDTTTVQMPKADYRTAMDLLEKADTAPSKPEKPKHESTATTRKARP